MGDKMDLLDTAIEAARAAGQEILKRLAQERDVHSKGFRNIVTDADLASQQILVAIIRSRFPYHGILSEEGLALGSEADTLWVLDPVDGTTNYSRRFPCFAISIGVVRGGAPVAGVVYDPSREHLFCVERGAGATLNGEPLHVSETTDLIHSIVGLDLARDPLPRADVMATMAACSVSIRTFRSFGSSALALCYVAAGWMDAYFHFSLSPWDCAAGGLAVLEAGGMVTGSDGTPWSYTATRILATNGKLHAAYLDLMHRPNGSEKP
jgi:myo-inositol-1(or 4)-monophosphatase